MGLLLVFTHSIFSLNSVALYPDVGVMKVKTPIPLMYIYHSSPVFNCLVIRRMRVRIPGKAWTFRIDFILVGIIYLRSTPEFFAQKHNVLLSICMPGKQKGASSNLSQGVKFDALICKNLLVQRAHFYPYNNLLMLIPAAICSNVLLNYKNVLL